MQTKKLPIAEIKENPKNPRFIRDDKFHKLVKSIQEFPEMLDVRPIVVNEAYVILGGNMRWKAAVEAGMTKIPVQIVSWDEEKQNQFLIKDNVSFGEWDWDVLANEWDATDLGDWGMNIWNPTEAYTPEITPSFAGREITDADMDKAQNMQNIVQINTKHECTCPACGHEFHIDR